MEIEPEEPQRRVQIRGAPAVARALDAGAPIRLLVVSDDADPSSIAALLDRARADGIAIQNVSARALRRLSPLSSASPDAIACDLIGLAGPSPSIDFEDVFERPGVIWLLVGCEYPGNAGWMIRSAEVSGAASVVIDADFERPQRRDSVRLSMRADRFFPVFFEETSRTVELARAVGRPVLVVEDVGTVAPWEADLKGDPLLVIGGERGGVPPELVENADQVIRIPMAGFLPTYNLQAAMAVVMGERLRQVGARVAPPESATQ